MREFGIALLVAIAVFSFGYVVGHNKCIDNCDSIWYDYLDKSYGIRGT